MIYQEVYMLKYSFPSSYMDNSYYKNHAISVNIKLKLMLNKLNSYKIVNND